MKGKRSHRKIFSFSKSGKVKRIQDKLSNQTLGRVYFGYNKLYLTGDVTSAYVIKRYNCRTKYKTITKYWYK